MLQVLFSLCGLLVGGVLWVKCAIVAGKEFLACPVRPLIVAAVAAVAIVWCFNGVVKEHVSSCAWFYVFMTVPFAMHALLAMF